MAKNYDAIVVGSGSGMFVVYEAVFRGLSVALVDKGPLGGTCPNLGCIPSKMLMFPADRIVEAPVIVTDQRDPSAWIKPVAGKPLTFRTTGVGRPDDVTLVPYHRLWNQKYAVYWQLTDEPGWQRIQAERKAAPKAEP